MLRRINNYLKLRRLLLFVPVVMFACRQPAKQDINPNTVSANPAEAIKEGKTLLKNGDLVLRTDLDLVSSSLRNFSETDKTYSHCGVVYFEDSAWYVYHLIAGDENPSGIIRKDPFDSFTDPHRKAGFGIFRYQFQDSEAAIFSDEIHADMTRKIHFDNLFDLKTDDSLYCAEMVYKALIRATGGRVRLHTTVKSNFRPKYKQHADKILKKFEYVALDNLYIHPFCREIKRFAYPRLTLEKQ